MASFHARYVSGDPDDVWRDLRGLGLRVFDAPYREDAEAVAREFADRARRNVEMLVERLQARGFRAEENDDEGTPCRAHVPPSPGAPALADWLEVTFAPFPMTVSAWIRQVGDVWLVGELPGWPASVLADPLVVQLEWAERGGSRSYYEAEHAAYLRDTARRDAGIPFQLDYAPDELHKANISGDAPYGIDLPGPGIDGKVGPAIWFVDDLNTAFAAGGFPGALWDEGYQEPPAGLRESLAAGLLRL
ncbi:MULTISPECIES: hypothetical protein [Micromonospora]|uniref:hypothetical protein n=1 Tax=Micromonospora TaxID=1873 RepID=UPI0013051F56|nr:hypothetical protein [Micromonospora sp. S4605]